MLADLQLATGFPCRLLAILLCESQHVVRRWLDGNRSPGRTARWKIALFHELLGDSDGFEVSRFLAGRSLRIAGDKSRSGEERVGAVWTVYDLHRFQIWLADQINGLAKADCGLADTQPPPGERKLSRGEREATDGSLSPHPGTFSASG